MCKFTEVLCGSNVSEASPILFPMFTYGRISHEAKGVSHGKEDAAVLSVHTCFTGEFLHEVKSHAKTRPFYRKVKVLTTQSVPQQSTMGMK